MSGNLPGTRLTVLAGELTDDQVLAAGRYIATVAHDADDALTLLESLNLTNRLRKLRNTQEREEDAS